MLKKVTIALVVFVFFLLAIAYFAWHSFVSPSNFNQETTVIIPKGTGFSKAIDLLAENKVITANTFIVKTIAYINGDAARIKAGEYRFPAGISAYGVIKNLVMGRVVVHKITIPEGLTVREILGIVKNEPILEGDVPEYLEEGVLFPETYHFTYGDSRISLIERMKEKMRYTLDELWEKRVSGLPLKNKKEALILASIVEKETGVPEERARVAAVFINRLKIGMKLQSDPTVAYGIELESGSPLSRPLVIADLKKPTAYNTYVIDTLPPEPIANPSRAAIEAVLNPMKTKEIYFVATGDGGHYFADNLAEHNQNVNKYRARMKNEGKR